MIVGLLFGSLFLSVQQSDTNLAQDYAEVKVAAIAGNIKQLKHLLPNRASLAVRVRSPHDDITKPGEPAGKKALFAAASFGQPRTVEYLLNLGMRSPEDLSAALVLACRAERTRTSYLPTIRFLLVHAANVDGGKGYFLEDRPLISAVSSAHPEAGRIARFLLDRGANVNLKGDFGRTPLHLIAEYGRNLEIAKLLIGKGAKVNTRDEFGKTPLFAAVHIPDLSLTRLLISRGCTINVRGTDGRTPLFDSAEQNNLRHMRLLLQAGADPTLWDKNRKTAIDAAREMASKEYLNYSDGLSLLSSATLALPMRKQLPPQEPIRYLSEKRLAKLFKS